MANGDVRYFPSLYRPSNDLGPSDTRLSEIYKNIYIYVHIYILHILYILILA